MGLFLKPAPLRFIVQVSCTAFVNAEEQGIALPPAVALVMLLECCDALALICRLVIMHSILEAR
jgi:hypothetical protein